MDKSPTQTNTAFSPLEQTGSVLANLYASTDKSLIESIRKVMKSSDHAKVKVWSINKIIRSKITGPQEIIDDLEFLENASTPVSQKLSYIRERY